ASLPPVDRTANAVLTFDVPPKHSAPLTRGFFFARQSVQAAISRECNAAHKAPPVSALKSAAAHNDANLASGGGHDLSQSSHAVRCCPPAVDNSDVFLAARLPRFDDVR